MQNQDPSPVTAMTPSTPAPRPSPRRQRGVATLVTTLVILFILTLIVLSSSNVALFEQKTALNENRQRHADQAAEYALRLGGEFMKASIVNLASEETDGWLASGTSRWSRCSSVVSMSQTHPCRAEPIDDRRAELYFYNSGGSTNVPFNVVTGVGVSQIGGSAAFPVTSTVSALLCRLDTTVIDTTDRDGDGNTTEVLPTCRATPDPDSANRIAITLIARSRLDNEGAVGTVKETWANFDTFSTASSVPLVASGTVDITGNVEIVTAPNGGGTGVPVSIWTPQDADVDCSGGGSCASISTCHLGEFIQDTSESTFKTTCPTVNNACGCPAITNASTPEESYATNPDILSGKVPSAIDPITGERCCENVDILDRDSGMGINPDIAFYPGGGIDNFADQTDDSLFEWVFGVGYENNTTRPDATTEGTGTGPTLTNCGGGGTTNCALHALGEDELGATFKTCAELNALGPAATGLYYITDSGASLCDLPAQVGTPDAPAVVVFEEQARINGTIFYGMLFIRSNDKTATLTFTGNADIYGALVVEGEATGHGNVTIVYIDTSASGPGKKLPENTRLGRVSGSWLDSTRGGF